MSKEKVTYNISVDETECNCGCGLGYNTPISLNPPLRESIIKLARNIQTLIVVLGLIYAENKIRVLVNSWCRCPSWNKHESGAENSKHLYGSAGDFRFQYFDHGWKDIPPVVVCQSAYSFSTVKDGLKLEFRGIGIYRGRSHLDVRGGPMKTWIKTDSLKLQFWFDIIKRTVS